MIDPGAGQLRIARGSALAALCLVLAAAGHVSGGGALPPPAALLAVGVLLGGAFVILAEKERGLGAIMLAALGSQLLFHLAFELTAHGTHSVGDDTLGDPSVASLWPDRMALAHTCAAAAVALLARYGDSLLWAAASLFGFCLIRSLRIAPVQRAPAAPRLLVLDIRSRPRVEARIRPGRGPPLAGIPT